MRKLLALALLIVLPPLAFYGWFEVSVRRIVTEQGLDGSYRNALKHASASSYLYSGLRLLGLSEAIAEEMVVRCGMVNEFAELYVKRGKPDTTLEIMKDLQNNMVGIGVALRTIPPKHVSLFSLYWGSKVSLPCPKIL